MATKIKILLLEDNAMDVKLLEKALEKDFVIEYLKVVDTETAFRHELEKEYDLIISDYKMPRFDGMQALQIRNQLKPLLPFIIVTGSMNEETAVECMQAGADDYIIKEHLLRLNQAVTRALEAKKNETDRLKARERVKILNRLLVTLRQVNRLITSEIEVLPLLQHACDIVVDEGMARAAWIGYRPDEQKEKFSWVQRGYPEDFKQKLDEYFKVSRVLPCGLSTLKTHKSATFLRDQALCKDCPLMGQFEDRQEVTLPLEYKGASYGVMGILIPDTISLTMEEISLYEEAASDVAYAVNHLLTEEKRAKADRVKNLLYNITQAALVTEDLTELLTLIHQYLSGYLQVSNFYVALYRPETDSYDFSYFKDAHDDVKTFNDVETRQGITDYVRRTGKPLLAPAEMQKSLVKQKEIKLVGHPAELWMGVPLETKNGIIGVMAMQNYEDAHAFTREDLDMLHFISGQVALSIEKRDLMDRLQESEAQFKAAFMASPDSITISRLSDGKYLLANQQFGKLIGYPEKDILGKTSVDLKIWEQPADRELFSKGLKEKGYLSNFETVFIHRKGYRLNVLISSRLIDLFGEAYVLSITRDITERKKTMDTIRLLSRAVEQSPVNVVITDIDGTIIYVNEKFVTTTGYTAREAIGKNPRILKSGQMPDTLYVELWDTITKGKEWQGELLNKKKDGTLYWESVSISPVLDEHNKITHFVAFKEDISQRKQFEEDLRKAKEKAEESDQLKSEFLANLSHEIRTPMNGIIGFSSLLEEDEDQTPETRSNYIRIIINSTQQLLRIITDILEISKLETHQVPLVEREVNINDLLLEAFSIFDLKARQKKLDLHLKKGLPDALARVKIDDVKLMKVLNNLLENAIKFTHQGYVEFGYSLAGNVLEFYVKDTGVGIRPEMKEIIFERFSQEEKELSQKAGGLGLGLSIAKANTELMGGNIRVGSEKGKGSTFYVRLPYHPIDQDALEAWKKNKTLSKNQVPAVLVVEDDEVNYQYLEVLLHKYDSTLKVLHANDGETAVEICRMQPDIRLVLMDVKMKSMSGLEATKLIKSMHPQMPVVVQSAYVTQKDEQMARDAGCDDFLPKPIDVKEFNRVLQSLLKR